MGESVATRQLNYQTPPRVGQIIVTTVTTTASQVTIPATFLNRYVTLQNDSANKLYYMLGATGTTPTPVAAAGVLGTATNCGVVAANGSVRFRLQSGVDGVIGYLASGTTIPARLFPSSNQEGYALGNPPGQP